MKHLGIVFTLAAILVVAATSPVSAAPYERRLELTLDDVRDSEVYNDLAEAVIGVRAFTGGGLTVAPLPNPAVGKFFGGAWGRGRGFDTVRVGTAGWRLFQLNDTVPGVRAELGNGVFLHAERGAKGTAFLFVGIASADGGAANLDAALNKDGKYWDKFCTAVAATPAVQNLNSKCADLDKRVGALEEKAGVKAPAKAKEGAKAGAEALPKSKEKTKGGGTPWLIGVVVVVLLAFAGFVIWLNRQQPDEESGQEEGFEQRMAEIAQAARRHGVPPVAGPAPPPNDLPTNGPDPAAAPPPADPATDPQVGS